MTEQADTVLELKILRSQTEAIQERLRACGVQSGAIGAARRLKERIDSAISLYEKHGDWTTEERLACNAWRMYMHTVLQQFPTYEDWWALSDEQRLPWRLAAASFRNDASDRNNLE